MELPGVAPLIEELAAEVEPAEATAPVTEAEASPEPPEPAAEVERPATPPRGAETPVEAPIATSFIEETIVGSTPINGTTSAEDLRLTSDADFIDLGEWLRMGEPVKSTRMVISEAIPTGDEQADFEEMLRRFKQGVAENVDDEDFDSHYDLGVAFKEMGLVDEAIAEFQKALRGHTHRERAYEALGQCFVEKGQLQVAITLLTRAVETSGADDQHLVGVLYLLGYATESMGRGHDALSYYQRVFAVDIEFRDVANRVSALERVTT
jgi:Flp pilus assembly protein TadD